LYVCHLIKGLGTLGAESSGINVIKLFFFISDAAAKQARELSQKVFFSRVQYLKEVKPEAYPWSGMLPQYFSQVGSALACRHLTSQQG
jgi:hypothetical protein